MLCFQPGHFFPPPLAFPGLCLRLILLSHQQNNSPILSNKEFNFNHLLKKKKIFFFLVSTDLLPAHAGPLTVPRPGFAHRYSCARAHTSRLLKHTKPFRSWAFGLLALSQLFFFFFPNGKPGKMIELVYVAKRLASTGSEGKKIELCIFFSLPLAKDLGAFDV